MVEISNIGQNKINCLYIQLNFTRDSYHEITFFNYNSRTNISKAYLYWIASFIRFNSMRHPTTMGDNEVELFLNHLVNQQDVAPNTQTQALNALSFLFKEVIKKPLSLGFIKSKRATNFTTNSQRRYQPFFKIINSPI